MTSAERPSPLLDIPSDASPGDVLRAIADWYDKTGEPMPNRITLSRHSRGDKGADEAYLAAFRERYDLPLLPVHTEGSSSTWAELPLVERADLDVEVTNFATVR